MSKKSGYLIHDFGNGKYAICKILSETSSQNTAEDLIIKLLTKQITENELISEYIKKIEATFQ